MASSSTNPNMIQFPRLPSVSPSWTVTENRSYPAPPAPPRAGRSLKQSRSSESLTQRKDRVEFLRKRESTRRAAAGSEQPNVSNQRRARTYSWEDIIAAADAAASTFDYNSSGSAGRPDTIDEADEGEPYVIYATSPRPPLQSSNSFPSPSYAYTPHTPGANVIYSTSPSPSPSPSPTLSPLPSTAPVRDLSLIGTPGPYYNRRTSWRGPHSRHSSLSSISEEDEGLARL